MVIVRVYAPDDPTSLVDTIESVVNLSWTDDLRGVGRGRVLLPGELATDIEHGSLLRFVRDGSAVFGFVVDDIVERSEESGTFEEIGGPGVLAWLEDGGVLGEWWVFGGAGADLSRESPSMRAFGYMSWAYSDALWGTPTDLGAQGQQDEPAGWLDPEARRIWSSTEDLGSVYFRKTFSTASPQTVSVMASSFGELQMWIDGVMVTSSTDPMLWKDTLRRTVSLAAGDHVVAIRVTNVQVGQPFLLFSMLPLGADGEVIVTTETTASQNEVQDVHLQARSNQGTTDGVFQLTFDGQTTGDIPYDASAAQIKTALDALSTIDEVFVARGGPQTGPIDWFQVVWNLGSHAGEPQPLLGLIHNRLLHDRQDVIRTQSGGTQEADVVESMLRSDTSWKILAYPPSPPGMTPGLIMKLVMEQNHDFGYLTDVSMTFDEHVDSESVDWPKEYELQVPVGSTVLTLSEMLSDLGVDVSMSPDLELRMFVDRGEDLTGSIEVTRVMKSTSRVSSKVNNSLLVRSDTGWSVHEDAQSIGDRGRKFGFVMLGSSLSVAAAGDLVEDVLSRVRYPKNEGTMSWPDGVGPTPYDDVEPGDWIVAPGYRQSYEQRIVAVAAELRDELLTWFVQVAP